MNAEMPSVAAIVLCGGKGTRMRAPQRNKVIFPVGGRPAICRALDVYRQCGVTLPIVVVGSLAGQVVDAVGPEHPNAVFVYQDRPGGTGHATRCGATVLRRLGFAGQVLVVAGDKVVRPRIVRRLLDAAVQQDADLALVTGPASRWPTSGRIVPGPGGSALGIVEVKDLVHALRTGKCFCFGGRKWTAHEIESCAQSANLSVYVFRMEALAYALDRLSHDNVQGEEYLTDAVALLVNDPSQRRRIVSVQTESDDEVLAFNTPEELAEVEAHVQRQEQQAAVTSVSRAYAAHPDVWEQGLERAVQQAGADPVRTGRLFRAALDLFVTHWGASRPVVLVRAPGRVNLMGRHVDHRGGHVNPIALDREIVCVCAARPDRQVHLRNVDAKGFAPTGFDLDDLLAPAESGEWQSFLNHEAVQRRVQQTAGHWANYVQAAILRFSLCFPERRLCGMDLAFAGDIPMAAGLSSSSALVVATALAVCALNDLSLDSTQVVNLCGEGEWYVGTRGGSSDHAAILLARPGQVAHFSFFPFSVERYLPFPAGCELLVADSGIEAAKAGGSRQTFNSRIFAYEAGLALLRLAAPAQTTHVQRLRDLLPCRLNCGAGELYDLVRLLPERMTPAALAEHLGEGNARALASRYGISWPQQPDQEPLRLRSVVLYGVAECERSRLAAGLLERGDPVALGAMMRVSHDGDRVARMDDQGKMGPFAAPCDDETLRRLAADARLGRPSAALSLVPGAYACSLPEIDRMIDTVLAVEGVYGAQLAGAGLGGCIMALCMPEATEKITRALEEKYYTPHHIPPRIVVCRAAPGACVLNVPG